MGFNPRISSGPVAIAAAHKGRTYDCTDRLAQTLIKILAKRGRPHMSKPQRALWEQLWNLPESAKSVLLIGHNPALQDLALELAHADLNELLASAGGEFPTGAMASFRFDGAWKALEPHGAVLASYITPKTIAVLSHDRRE